MNYYNEINNELLNNEINKSAKNYSINKCDLTTYYYVGKMLSEVGKQYGKNIIKEYSVKLSNELAGNILIGHWNIWLNSIIIKNNSIYSEISEKVLKKLILENIENFMSELGSSFCFLGSEYQIKMDDRYNYIDLLLFNLCSSGTKSNRIKKRAYWSNASLYELYWYEFKKNKSK